VPSGTTRRFVIAGNAGSGLDAVMGTAMHTSYSLPFDVLHSRLPLLSSGADIELQAVFDGGPSQRVAEILDDLVQPFLQLASSGAVSGASVSPQDSGIANVVGPVIRGQSVQWAWQGCRIDEQGLAMLAQMLSSVQRQTRLRRLTVSSVGDMADLPLQLDTDGRPPYPKLGPSIPFLLRRCNDWLDVIIVRVRFVSVPDEDERGEIEARVFEWAAGLVCGAYGVAPIPPDQCVADFDECEWSGADLEIPLTNFQAHPLAVDGLLNALIAVHYKAAPIDEVDVE
jgi:hypothetical protein